MHYQPPVLRQGIHVLNMKKLLTYSCDISFTLLHLLSHSAVQTYETL